MSVGVFQNDCGYGGMVDTGDLKSPALRVPVRVRVPVPKSTYILSQSMEVVYPLGLISQEPQVQILPLQPNMDSMKDDYQ